jgi:F0F1-type ATP synthase membrane subunit b/b'
MGNNPLDEMDPDLKAMRGSMRPSGGTMRWGRILTALLVVACLTFGFAFYLPLVRAHEALTKHFSEVQTRVDSAKKSESEARADVKELQEKQQELEAKLKQAEEAKQPSTNAGSSSKSALEAKLQKPLAKDQAALGSAEGHAVAGVSLGFALTKGKLAVSPDGQAALCGVASTSSKRPIRVLAIADKKSIPPTLAVRLKTPLDYSSAVAALVVETLRDKCKVDPTYLSATGFPAEPAAPQVEGKRLSGARVELWLAN